MKLHVRLGPLPLEPPDFDWDEDEELDPREADEEIDLTDLLDKPPAEVLH